MRIALITRRFDPNGGGTERDLMVTAGCLREAGWDVAIYAAEIRGTVQGLAVKRVGVLPLGRAAGLLAFAYAAPAAARRNGTAMVLSFARVVGADVLRSGGSAHVSYLRAARRWRSPTAASAMWLSPYHRVQMFIERKGFRSRRLKLAIAVSELVRRDLVREFALAPDKIVTLYNGVDLSRFRPAANEAERCEARARFGIVGSAPVVLFVGNGFARKGLHFLIEAWPRVGRDARLLVIGSDRMAASYERLAAHLGMNGRVHFAGPQPDIERIFHGADALALPSLFEPFGNVVMEAMASGIPALTSAQAGVSEVLPEPMQAFVVADPTSPPEIAARMNGLLEWCGGLGEAARATAEQYTWRAYGEHLNRILSALR